MTSERLSSPPLENRDKETPGGEGAEDQETRRIGPLSDYADLGVEFYPKGDASSLLEKLKTPRNPDEDVKVSEARDSVKEHLGQVAKLIEREKEKEKSLDEVRKDLALPYGEGETLKKLEEARKQLEEDARHIELASEYNETLDSFSDLSSEERKHIAETGKTRKGEYLKDRHGKKIESDIAKELAHLYAEGGRRITWRMARKLGQVADRILHDIVSAVKGVLRGTGNGEGEEKSLAE